MRANYPIAKCWFHWEHPSETNARCVLAHGNFLIRDVSVSQKFFFSICKAWIYLSFQIFNLTTHQWNEANLLYGPSDQFYCRAGINYPQCLSLTDQWFTVCDRTEGIAGSLYILSPSSGFQSVPHDRGRVEGQDSALPFYKFDLKLRTWTRLASLPESLSNNRIKLCMCDGEEGMATCVVWGSTPARLPRRRKELGVCRNVLFRKQFYLFFHETGYFPHIQTDTEVLTGFSENIDLYTSHSSFTESYLIHQKFLGTDVKTKYAAQSIIVNATNSTPHSWQKQNKTIYIAHFPISIEFIKQ